MSRIEESLYRKYGLNKGVSTKSKRRLTEDLEDVPEDLYQETWNYVEYLLRGFIRNTITPGQIADFVDGYDISWAKDEYDISREVWSEDLESTVQAIMEGLFVGYPEEDEEE